MSSLKMTFSLASLILMFGLVFVVTPAMAQIERIAISDPAALNAGGYLIIRQTTEPLGLPATAPDGSEYVTVADADWPDLDALFNNVGGTIMLTASTSSTETVADGATRTADFMFDSNGDAAGGERDLKLHDLVITEIMWGINKAAAGTDLFDKHQWIEVWNNTGQTIDADILATLSLSVEYGRPAPANDNMAAAGAVADSTPAAGRVTLDRVSNVVGNGWVNDLGQSGSDASTDTATDENMEPFISMYRDSKGDRGRQIGDGHAKGSWKKSTETYLANHVGTPGAAERVGPRTFSASGVGLKTIFNEIANFPAASSEYEWIELRVKEGTPNFENWRVHIVTGADNRKTDDGDDPDQRTLFTLPKITKVSFAAGDILLIVKEDPAGDEDHPLRGGRNVELDAVDQRPGHDPNIWYYVADDWKIDLPDGGEFVLILRHGNDKKNHEKVEDLAGYHPNLAYTAENANTNLWPLVGYPKPNRTHNKIEDGEVARRVFDDIAGVLTKDGDKNDKVAFRHDNNGYTGVGYKRSADADPQHGGTPGYPHASVKEKESDLADGAMVTISEIMYDTGNRLPQWIELYNGSKTQGVNLNEWKLKIETNAGDADVDIRKPAVTIQFGGTIIPPLGTVLLTSTSTTQATDDIDVDHQIIDFWMTASIKSKLEVAEAGRRYQLLSTTAFKLTLMEKGGGVVDVVGNLGDDGEAMWALPMADEDAEGRSSIIRRYDEGVARDGILPAWSGEGSIHNQEGLMGGEGNAGWVLASETDLPYEATYYGDRDDIGTPGYIGGGALPVSLSKFRPERMKDTGAVVIRWITESELNNAGFNILRSETRDGEFTKINTKLIAGQGTTSERSAYEYADTSAKPNVVYYYQIQDVSLDGQVTTLRTTHLRGNVTAAGKLTTTWGELKALQ